MPRLLSIIIVAQLIAGGCFIACSGNYTRKPTPAPSDSMITLISEMDTVYGLYYKNGLNSGPAFLSKNIPLSIKSRVPIYIMQPDINQTGYYLLPGDSVIVTKDRSGSIRFNTKDTVRNSEVMFFSQLSRDIGSIRHLGNLTYIGNGKPDMKTRDELINKKYQYRLNYLKEYQAKHHMSENVVDYARKSFYYSSIYEKLYLYYPGYNRKDIRSFYLDSLSGFRQIFNCDTCLNNAFFTDALVQLARAFIQEGASGTSPYLFFSGLSTAQMHQIYDSVNLHFSGRVRSFLQSDILNQLILNKQINQAEAEQLCREITDADLSDQISRQIKLRYKRNAAGDLSGQKLFSPDSSSQTWNALLKKHQNRVLYIDVWASWCTPCIAEMPASRALKNKYAGKPIDFIYISLDEQFEKWKTATESQHIQTLSYWADGDFASPFAKKFKVGAIPRYIIIDKTGRVFSDDAMRPGDANLEPVINNLIKQ